MFTNFCQHLAEKYPEQWHALSKNALGNNIRGDLNKSLSDGFFSTIADPKLQRFKQFNLYACVVVGVVGLIVAYL
ncbi:hypothetical protein [Pseudoalteromonas mariniglutinosa]|uniref:hypothetical protein n=1 Tax=Pseudoalteromonas mariniglutinosa TaxID=206042 RepID=UPI00384D1232